MTLLMTVVGVAGLTVLLTEVLESRWLGPVPSVLVASLAGWLAAGITFTWTLLLGLGLLWPSVVFGVAAGAAGGSRWRGDGRARETFRQASVAVREHAVVWGVAGVLVVAQVTLSLLVLRDVGDVGWDAGTYHLPTVGSMLQSGSLFGFPDLRAWTFYPALVEVQAAVVGAGLGSMKAASATQLGYWVWLLLFSTAVLAPRARASVTVASLLTIAAVPTLWLQARTLYVDVAFAAIFCAATLVVLAAWRERERRLVLLAAGLVGALFGIKLGALSAAPLVVLVALLALWRTRMRIGIVAVVLLGVVAATPFMIRNAVEWSNPLYPVSLTEPREPVTEWPGYAPYSLTEIRWYVDASQRPPSLREVPLPEASVRQYVLMPAREFAAVLGLAEGGVAYRVTNYDSREGGFGAAWVLLALAAVVAAAAAWRAGRSELVQLLRSFVGPMLGVGAASFLLTQSQWWPRFTLGIGVLVVWAAAALLDRVRWAPVAAGVVSAVAAVGLVSAELGGGHPHWTSCEGPGCVVDADDREVVRELGLSGLTTQFAPLVRAGVDSVAIVGDRPNFARPYFPAGLWAPDFEVEVTNLVVGSEPSPGACADAYLTDPDDLAWTTGWIEEADPAGSFTEHRFDDRGDERVLLVRDEGCVPGEG